ncbi:MAG TPA: metal ABC transporter permease [Solirubrobacteraceae bacterium]|jgi:zinc/manganese transport system permease protein|nr:metal ABC transporter permease [Solirubrobacteraceae bacterium]
MFSLPFVRDALLAGSLIAAASGLLGYFIVLRAQVFAGDALSHVAFTGALAAAAAGIDLRAGLFAATIAVALLLASLGERARADDVTVGVVFAWVLGVGVLLLDVFNSGSGGTSGVIGARALFGSIFSLSGASTLVASLVALVLIAATLLIARPLLFASLDPTVALARGVPARALGTIFLVLVGADAAEASQAIGALLLLGLLAAPAGAAHRVTSNPYAGMALAAALAVASVWIGVALSYSFPALPPGATIVLAAAAIYAVTVIGSAGRVLRWAR